MHIETASIKVGSILLLLASSALLAAASCSPANPQTSSATGAESSLPPEPAEPSPTNAFSQTEPQIVRANLEDFGPAPELNNEVWLNTDEPLRLENLRGKVVLLDMWTFG